MSDSVLILTLAGAVTVATPMVLAGTGELLNQRAGTLNLSIEGTMLLGAVVTFAITASSGSLEVGIMAAAAVGAMVGLALGFLTITVRANHILAGLALLVFTTGLARFLGEPFGFTVIPQRVAAVQVPILADIPVVGPILFRQNMFVYVSWLCILLASYHLHHTRPGLSMRSVGEAPAAADAVGIGVARTRYLYAGLGGALAGVAGANVMTVIVTSWNAEDTTVGLGWIAFALVVFSGWEPYRLLFGAYLFGLLLRSNFAFQALGFEAVPSEMLRMMPYLLTIVALLIVGRLDRRRSRTAPEALGVTYAREAR